MPYFRNNASILKTACAVVFVLLLAQYVSAGTCVEPPGPCMVPSYDAPIEGETQPPQGLLTPRNDATPVADPVYPSTGDFYQTAHDLVVPSRGFPFDFSRVYRSQLGITSSLGVNWDFDYNRHLDYFSDRISLFYGHRDDPGLTSRALLANDFYQFDSSSGKYVAPQGNYDFIIQNGDGTHSLKKPGGMDWIFYGPGAGTLKGKLKAIKDRNGNQMQFAYTNGKLTQITDTLARNYTMAYDASGNLRTLTDFNSRVITYSVDANRDLRSVTSPPTSDFPSGRTTRYTYSNGYMNPNLNHNLLTITDPKNQTYLTNVYGTNPSQDSYDKVVSQQYGSGTSTFQYFVSQKRTRVTDRNGNITDWFFDGTGAPSSKRVYSNRDVNPADPAFFLTTYTHNPTGERTTTTFPRGNSETVTYDLNNPDIRQRGNVLNITRSDGPLGSSPNLITSFTYEQNFQFVKTTTDPRGNIITNFFDYEEATLGDLNGDGDTTQANGNVVKVLSPNVTQGLSSPQQPATKITYNSFGQPLKMIHPEGNFDEYTYYAAGPSTGYLQTIARDRGGENVSQTMTYDPVGNLTSITDGKGAVTTYMVNAVNQVTHMVGRPPLNIATDYSYDANGNVTQVDVDNKDENGNYYANQRLTSSWTYDNLDHVKTATNEVDPTKTLTSNYDYDANENLIRTTSPLGNKVRTIYDERELPYRVIRGEGTPEASTVTMTYDSNGNSISTKDGQNKTWLKTYDGFDRLLTSTTPIGFLTTLGYDANSNLTSSRANGHLNHSGGAHVRLVEARYSYDELNRTFQSDAFYFDPATQTNLPDGPATPGDGKVTTRYKFDLNSRMILVQDDLNRDATFTYDGLNRQKTIADPLGNVITTAYDANSNVTSVFEHELPQGGGPTVDTTTTFTYDGLDRMRTKVVQNGDPLSQTTNYDYDSRNNMVKLTDAKGNTSGMSYDGLNRLLQRTIDLRVGGVGTGAITHSITMPQTWDDDSRLKTQTDDNNHTTTYSYDALNRLTSTLYADVTTSRMTYDANDNVLTTNDQNGSFATNTYDNDNRLIGRSIARAAGVIGVAAETYGYDGLNRQTLAQDEDSTVTSTYDSLSQPRMEVQNSLTLNRNFNSVGHLLSMTYPGGRQLDQTFDLLDRLQTIGNHAGSQIVDNNYIGFGGRMLGRTFGNGTKSTFSYDTIRRATSMLDEKISPLTTVTDFQYAFDRVNDRLYEKKNHAPWNGKGDVFIYDSAMRLDTAKRGVTDPIAESNNPGTGGAIDKTISYALDGVGNRTSVTENGTPTSYVMDVTTPNPADFQMNQYTTVGGTGHTYDANGNLKSDGTYQYSFDYRNQLVEVKNAAGTSMIATYKYDPFGRRFEKDVGGTVTKFLYNGFETVEERDGSDAVQATYVWGQNANELISLRRGVNDYTMHQNSLGSPSAVTDSSGNTVERYDYDPFGKVTFRNGAGAVIGGSDPAISNPYLFTGQRLDPETGLYDYHNRMYNPALGRFIQRDPIGTWTDPMNLGNGVAYVGNNPVNQADAMGLSEGGIGHWLHETSEIVIEYLKDQAVTELPGLIEKLHYATESALFWFSVGATYAAVYAPEAAAAAWTAAPWVAGGAILLGPLYAVYEALEGTAEAMDAARREQLELARQRVEESLRKPIEPAYDVSEVTPTIKDCEEERARLRYYQFWEEVYNRIAWEQAQREAERARQAAEEAKRQAAFQAQLDRQTKLEMERSQAHHERWMKDFQEEMERDRRNRRPISPREPTPEWIIELRKDITRWQKEAAKPTYFNTPPPRQ